MEDQEDFLIIKNKALKIIIKFRMKVISDFLYIRYKIIYYFLLIFIIKPNLFKKLCSLNCNLK